jgi:chromate reductase, NAD(P)H dehydrogenase (quinone)
MQRVAALCGSRRRGSFNRLLLAALAERAPDGLQIVEVDIRDIPLFDQDFEADPPPAVLDAKAVIQECDCVLLVSPEYDYGVPGYLKNAVDWLSRPFADPTLVGRPMAVCGASSGYMGTIRGQLHWRQSWYYFKAPVFSEAELTVSFAGKAFDEEGRLISVQHQESADRFLAVLLDWLARGCSPPR